MAADEVISMAVGNSTIIQNTVVFIRNLLLSGVTDPQSTKRPTESKFVATSYTDRKVWYPRITVKNTGCSMSRAGQNTEEMYAVITTEVRVWARAVDTRDELTDDVLDTLRTSQQGTGGTIEEGLHDFDVGSVVPVDEEGETGIHSSVITITHGFVTGQ